MMLKGMNKREKLEL